MRWSGLILPQQSPCHSASRFVPRQEENAEDFMPGIDKVEIIFHEADSAKNCSI